MKINEIVQRTGLTKKAIRLYESKGLISVNRENNGYRDYSDEDVRLFEKIKLLRSAGISLIDIKLLFSDLMTLEEVVEKRKNELDREKDINIEQYSFCEIIIEKYR